MSVKKSNYIICACLSICLLMKSKINDLHILASRHRFLLNCSEFIFVFLSYSNTNWSTKSQVKHKLSLTLYNEQTKANNMKVCTDSSANHECFASQWRTMCAGAGVLCRMLLTPPLISVGKLYSSWREHKKKEGGDLYDWLSQATADLWRCFACRSEYNTHSNHDTHHPLTFAWVSKFRCVCTHVYTAEDSQTERLS